MTEVPIDPENLTDVPLAQNGRVLMDAEHKGPEFNELRAEYRRVLLDRGLSIEASFKHGKVAPATEVEKRRVR